MRSQYWSLCLVGLLGWSSPAPAQEMPRAIIERAIQAHGGMQRLAQLRADRVKIKGTVLVGGKMWPFTDETLVQLPDKFKHVQQITLDTRAYTVVQVMNGDQVWVTLDGQPQKVEAANLAEMRSVMALARAVRLVPLLTDKNYQLAALEETKVNDRPALGVKVSLKDFKDLKLFFDKESGLLVKTSHVRDDAGGKEVEQEEYYSDFRDLGGYKRAAKMSAFRKGAKVMEAELVEVKYFDRFDDAEFAKP